MAQGPPHLALNPPYFLFFCWFCFSFFPWYAFDGNFVFPLNRAFLFIFQCLPLFLLKSFFLPFFNFLFLPAFFSLFLLYFVSLFLSFCFFSCSLLLFHEKSNIKIINIKACLSSILSVFCFLLLCAETPIL